MQSTSAIYIHNIRNPGTRRAAALSLLLGVSFPSLSSSLDVSFPSLSSSLDVLFPSLSSSLDVSFPSLSIFDKQINLKLRKVGKTSVRAAAPAIN